MTISPPTAPSTEWPHTPPPDPPVPRALLTAALVAGIGSAAAVPAGNDGLGWFVAALVVAGAVAAAGWRTAGSLRLLVPRPARLETAAWALAALALAAVAAFRAAPWLVALCLLTAAVSGCLAVAGRLMTGVPRAVFAVPLAALRAVPWLGRSTRAGWRTGDRGNGLRLVVSVLVGLLLLLVFGALLASADAVFAGLLDAVLPTVDGDTVVSWVILFVFGALAVSGAGYLLVAPPALVAPRPGGTGLRTRDWALPVGALVGLFTVFVGVQFAALFGSRDHVVRTTGLTFAEYARGGFWQLLAVSVLALAVILAGLRWAPVATATDRLVKRTLLVTLAGLCLVVVASALRRMWLYQEEYGFTVLRLLVGVCELWLGLAFLLVAVAVLRLRRSGPVKPMVGTAVAALLALAVLDPERFIAQQNVDRFLDDGRVDAYYLSGLSADAVPELLRLPAGFERDCVLSTIAGRNQPVPDADWRQANLSRAIAQQLLDGLDDRSCSS